MANIHRKLYATLVGDVDNTISYITELLCREACGKMELQDVALRLKAALEKVEEMYIQNEDSGDEA